MTLQTDSDTAVSHTLPSCFTTHTCAVTAYFSLSCSLILSVSLQQTAHFWFPTAA